MDNNGFTINPKLYDFLKWAALVLLPAAASLYVALGSLWDFPAIQQVVGTMTAIDAFLGLILNKSAKNFDKQEVVGAIVVQQDRFGTVSGMKLVADRDPLILDEQRQARFNVRREIHLE
jgi:hypothetical protein